MKYKVNKAKAEQTKKKASKWRNEFYTKKASETYHEFKQLHLHDVVGRSEQLSQCKCGNAVQIECDC